MIFFQSLRECDQLILPPESVLSPFTLVRAPQGLTEERFKSLKTLSEKLSPIERYVSVIVDETALNPRLAFDSNGMIIGRVYILGQKVIKGGFYSERADE